MKRASYFTGCFSRHGHGGTGILGRPESRGRPSSSNDPDQARRRLIRRLATTMIRSIKITAWIRLRSSVASAAPV